MWYDSESLHLSRTGISLRLWKISPPKSISIQGNLNSNLSGKKKFLLARLWNGWRLVRATAFSTHVISCACQQPTRFDWLSAHGHALLANQIVTHHLANQDVWTFGTTRRLNAVSDKQRPGVTQCRYQGFIFSKSCSCLIHPPQATVPLFSLELIVMNSVVFFSDAESWDFSNFGCLHLLLSVDCHILFAGEKCNTLSTVEALISTISRFVNTRTTPPHIYPQCCQPMMLSNQSWT